MYSIFSESIYEEFGVVEEPELPPRVSFQAGRLIGKPLEEPLRFVVSNTKTNPPTDFLGQVIPVMSDALVGALAANGIDNLQIFRAELENRDTGGRWPAYSAVNVVGAIACADMTRSTYTDPGRIGLLTVNFTELVINPEKANGAGLFRLAQSARVLLIRNDLRDRLLDWSPRLRGLYFEDVREA